MGFLKGSSVYLIGSIDHHSDPHKWRLDIADELLYPLGVKVYDPLSKPEWFNHQYPVNGDFRFDFMQFKKLLTGDIHPDDIDSVSERMWAIRDLCLRMAHDANFIICSLPKKFTVGTLEELSVAAQARKPILFYLPDGYDTSTWLPPQLGRDLKYFMEHSFDKMDDLYEYLRSVDNGSLEVDNFDWLFISYFHPNFALK